MDNFEVPTKGVPKTVGQFAPPEKGVSADAIDMASLYVRGLRSPLKKDALKWVLQ